METTTYNGWTNYETWNIWLWLNNDEMQYGLLIEFLSKNPTASYQELISWLELTDKKTPDGVAYISHKIDRSEIEEAMRETADTLDINTDEDTTDLSADADWLASAGWGTDEDYGSYGSEDY